MRSVLFLTSLLAVGTAQADVLGLTAEYGMFSPDADVSFSDHDSNTSGNTSDLDSDSGAYYGIAFEHPIPLIPNIRLQSTSLEVDGTATVNAFNGQTVSGKASLDLSHTDYTLYYEFLDGLLWLDLDAGVTLRNFDGSISLDTESADFDATIPMGYVSAYASIPGTSVAVGGELKALALGDSSLTDTTLKIKYESPFLVGVEGGYRSLNIELVDIDGKDITSDNSGFFIGAFVDF